MNELRVISISGHTRIESVVEPCDSYELLAPLEVNSEIDVVCNSFFELFYVACCCVSHVMFAFVFS